MSEYIMLGGVSYAYPGSSVSVFENLSLSFSAGWTVIAGANGAGKTTLASIIAGDIIPDKGSVRRSGEAVVCSQVFTGLRDDDLCYIYDGSSENGHLRSRLGITDEMIRSPENLSGGEKKRLQLLAALSRHPSVLILDEPTNHLDAANREIIISVLRDFDGAGIIITHDRNTADALSGRTVILERGTESPASVSDIPLPLSAAFDELERRKAERKARYDRLSSDIADGMAVAARLSEKSERMQSRLSKRGIDVHDHSAKAEVDGARLTGKDRSLSDQRRRILSRVEKGSAELTAMERPLMRKEGLSLSVSDAHLPSFSFGPALLSGGDYQLAVPEISFGAGERVAITGLNGTGKTLLVSAICRNLREKGRESLLMYIPQEYSEDDIGRIRRELDAMNDEEKGMLLSDLYRLGSNPSFLLDPSVSPSPGELKKLDFILARRAGKNIMIMDEPTNHLDIVSARILEKMLTEDGRFTLILVSHDEAFIKAVCTRRIQLTRDGYRGSVSVP